MDEIKEAVQLMENGNAAIGQNNFPTELLKVFSHDDAELSRFHDAIVDTQRSDKVPQAKRRVPPP